MGFNSAFKGLKNFVYPVGLHIYYKIIHGPYNIKLKKLLKKRLDDKKKTDKKSIRKCVICFTVQTAVHATQTLMERRSVMDCS